ncbi:DUF4097 family beta strand repeat-containing protein [Actinocorallia aurea]
MLLLAALSACGSSADEAVPEDRVFAYDGTALTIAKDRGDLEVAPADVSGIEVTRWFTKWAFIGSDPRATWDLRDGTLRLATDCDALVGGCSVRYRILVPRGTVLTVEGENGRIAAKGFATALTIRTQNGAVAVSDSSGPLDLRTENGEIRGTGLGSGRVKARTQNGSVRLTHTAAPASVDVTTENGAATLELPDAPYRQSLNSENGKVRSTLPNSPTGPAVTVRTENGAITLTS